VVVGRVLAYNLYTIMAKKSELEKWLDKHNHTMGFLRTLFGLISSVTGVLIFIKVFEII
jgi:hypothetical protein